MLPRTTLKTREIDVKGYSGERPNGCRAPRKNILELPLDHLEREHGAERLRATQPETKRGTESDST